MMKVEKGKGVSWRKFQEIFISERILEGSCLDERV
jgi:hypothetical protein